MNTPKIRFKGFTDDWEQRKLGEIVLRESLARESTIDLPYVEYEDVIAEEGRINKDIRKKEGIKKGIFFDGSQVLYGKLRPYLHNWLNPDFSGVAVGDWWVLKPNNVDKNFIYRLIQTQQFDDIANQSTGSKMPRADWNLVSNTEFAIPTSQVEQTKIGGYFFTLDNLITLHQRKCDETKQLKKFMLQKMFPKNGEKNPEIRFKGFTDDWEQRKVGEVTKELLDYDNFSSGLPLLTSSRSGLMYQSEYRGNATTENENTLFSVVPLNACTYRHMSDDSTFHLNINTLEKGLVSKEYPVFQENESNLKFIVQYINSSNSFTKFCTEQKKGGTRTRLYYKTLCEYKLMMPSIKEQNKTANFFDTLDHLITLHQRKCEKLKELKKFMLQNMFV